MKHLFWLLLFFITAGPVPAQKTVLKKAGRYDVFLGEFYIIEHGKKVLLFRISKSPDRPGNSIYLQEWVETKHAWSEVALANKISIDNEYDIGYNYPELRGKYGLDLGSTIFIKVPIGWRFGNFVSKTGLCIVSNAEGPTGLDVFRKGK